MSNLIEVSYNTKSSTEEFSLEIKRKDSDLKDITFDAFKMMVQSTIINRYPCFDASSNSLEIYWLNGTSKTILQTDHDFNSYLKEAFDKKIFIIDCTKPGEDTPIEDNALPFKKRKMLSETEARCIQEIEQPQLIVRKPIDMQSSHDDDISNLKESLEGFKHQLAQNRNEVSSLIKDRDELSKKIQEKEAEVAKLCNLCKEIEKKLMGKDKEIEMRVSKSDGLARELIVSEECDSSFKNANEANEAIQMDEANQEPAVQENPMAQLFKPYEL